MNQQIKDQIDYIKNSMKERRDDTGKLLRPKMNNVSIHTGKLTNK